MELGVIWKPVLSLVRVSWLIRIIPGSESDWEKGTGDPESLAGAAFSKSREDVSVFRVHNDVEEAAVIAAHQLTRNHLQPKIAAVRFSHQEAREAGLDVKITDGGTGVTSADRAHRDLTGGKENYLALTRIVLERQLAGCDRVRRVQKNRLLFQLCRLLESGKGMTPDAREKCTNFTT